MVMTMSINTSKKIKYYPLNEIVIQKLQKKVFSCGLTTMARHAGQKVSAMLQSFTTIVAIFHSIVAIFRSIVAIFYNICCDSLQHLL